MSLGYGGVCRKAPDEERLFQQHSNETEYARYKHDLTNGSPITVKPVLRGQRGSNPVTRLPRETNHEHRRPTPSLTTLSHTRSSVG